MALLVKEFANGSWIKSIDYGSTYRSSRAKTILGDEEINDMFEIKRHIVEPECDQFGNRNLDLFRREYEEIQEMRVLFVRPEVYNAVCEWDEGLNNVLKHHKVTAIYKSISEFREQFDKDKFGVRYTTFYFDNMLAPTEIYESFKEFVRLYGEADARYISEALKMRTIDVGELMWRNNFDYFKVTSIDPDCIEDTIKQAAIEQTECYCISLL